MTFTVNKNSFHYRFLRWYTIQNRGIEDTTEDVRFWIGDQYGKGPMTAKQKFDKYLVPNNFCTYWRKTVINPLIRFSINIGLIAASGYFLYIGLTFAPLAAIGFIAGILAAIAALGGLAVGVGCILEDYRPHPIRWIKNYFSEIADDPDTLIGMAIKSHNEKICVKVDYKD
jgi:hypothetical protein